MKDASSSSHFTPAKIPSASLARWSATHSCPDSPDTHQPAQSGPPTVANAHFGHSVYFIEHLFPSKLWRILDDAERCEYDHIISWVDNGMAFQIHDRESVIPILEKYFNMSKYKSFLRQLQAYGFQRALPNPKDDPNRDSKPKRDCYRGKWSHKLFRRDKMNLCNKMTRDGKKQQQEKEQTKFAAKCSKVNTTGLVPSRALSSAVSTNPQSAPGSMKGAPTPSAAPAMIEGQQQQAHQDAKRTAMEHQIQQQLLHQHLLNRHQPPHTRHHFHYNPRYPGQQFPQQYHHAHQQPPMPAHRSDEEAHGFTHPALLAIMKHQQGDEQRRKQLQMQINQLKEQQLLSSILVAQTESDAKANRSRTTSPTEAKAGALVVGGVNYNDSSSSKESFSKAPLSTTNDAVSAAADELRRAELALMERRKRLIEAQDQAQKEVEDAHQKRAVQLQAEESNLVKKIEIAKKTASLRSLDERGKLAYSSLLQDLDNAFQSTGAAAVRKLSPSDEGAGKDSVVNNSNVHKITKEELFRAKHGSNGEIAMDHLVHAAPNGTSSKPPEASAPSDHEVVLARLKAMEQIQFHEHRRRQEVAKKEQHQQDLLMQIMAEHERGASGAAASDSGANAGQTSSTPSAVRDAIRHAALGLISGDSTNGAPESAVTKEHPYPHDLRHGMVGSKTAAPRLSATPAVLSLEMMDVFAKTAAAAIAKKKETITPASTPSAAPATSAFSTLVTAPTSPSHQPAAFSTSIREEKSKATTAEEVGPIKTEGPANTVVPSGAASVNSVATETTTSRSIGSSAELDAIKALMCIPGSVVQAKEAPILGHWELVRPEEFKPGTKLSTDLPDTVAKSSGLSDRSYRKLALSMSPPRVMRVPDTWKPNEESMYLVVDPAISGSPMPRALSSKSGLATATVGGPGGQLPGSPSRPSPLPDRT